MQDSSTTLPLPLSASVRSLAASVLGQMLELEAQVRMQMQMQMQAQAQ